MPETLTDAQKVLRNDTGKRIAVALEALASEVDPSTVIAPEYDATQTYAVGDLVMYRSVLYRCTTPIDTPEEWTAAHWTATMVSDEYRPAAEQDVIDANLMALGLTGASVGDLVRVAAVDANGKPTSWSHVAISDVISEEIENTFSGLGMFNRIGVIGDSFSSGGINPDGTSYQKTENSWIQVIGRKLGIAAVNYSRNGYNSRSFVNPSSQYYNTVGLGALIADTATNNACGCYIFAMGINDVALGDSYIGSSSDIHTADPSQNPDTFYGNVGKIISNILTYAPNSKIIMSMFSRPTTSTEEAASYNLFNSAIIAIADYFSLPYIDVRDDPYFTSDYYINNLKRRHPTLDMYIGYANAIMRLCADCIIKNNNYFYNYKNLDIYNDTYYHPGDRLTFDNTYAQWVGVATSTTELRIFIPFSKPVKATSFNITGGFLARSGANDAGIQGAFVEGTPTGNDCVLGHQYIAENGIAFGLTFASGVIFIRNLYAFQPSSSNPLIITFT